MVKLMPKKPKTKPKSKKKPKGKRGKPPKRMPSVPSMRNAITRTLDKLGLRFQVQRDNRSVLIVAHETMAPFTINLANGKVEDIDISKGATNVESENPGHGVSSGPDNATHVAAG